MVAFLNPAIFMPAKRPPVAGGRRFELASSYQPAGDQPGAIAELTAGVQQGERNEVCGTFREDAALPNFPATLGKYAIKSPFLVGIIKRHGGTFKVINTVWKRIKRQKNENFREVFHRQENSSEHRWRRISRGSRPGWSCWPD